MKKKIALILTLMIGLFCFSGCTSSESTESETKKETKEISFSVPDGLPAIGISKMIKEDPQIDENYDVSYTIEANSESLMSSVMKEEPDVVIVPSNSAATVYNKTQGYKIAGTLGWGSFYIGTTLENQTIEDLKNKEVYNIGKGLTPDIITKSILKDKGIDVDNDINFSYVNGVSELAPIILSGKTEFAVIPEPALSTVQSKNDKFNVILNLNEEWKNINDSEYGYPQSTILVKNDLIESDKELVDKLLKNIEESSKWIFENKETTAEYCGEIGVSASKDIIAKAIDNSNIKYVGIKDCYKEYEIYFNKLNEFDPKTIGGTIPDEEIFMEK